MTKTREMIVGGVAFTLDVEDYERVAARSWWLRPHGHKQPCAFTSIGGKGVSLHRLLMAAGPGEIVDHADGDRQNNRRENLRIASSSQSMANRKTWNRHGYRGVEKSGAKWRATSKSPDGAVVRRYGLATAEAAARAYDALAREHYGEFAALNFPEAGERGARRSQESLGAPERSVVASPPGAQASRTPAGEVLGDRRQAHNEAEEGRRISKHDQPGFQPGNGVLGNGDRPIDVGSRGDRTKAEPLANADTDSVRAATSANP